MITKIEISDLYVLSDNKGYVYPRIFISREDAEKCRDVIGKEMIITCTFINN